MLNKIKAKLTSWLKHPTVESKETTTARSDVEYKTEEQGKYDGYSAMVNVIKNELYEDDLKKKKAISINQVPVINYNIGA